MKKWLVLLLVVLPLCPACAQSWVEDLGMIYDYRYTEFEQEVPAELAQALEASGWDSSAVVCGAVREPAPMDENAFSSIALLGIRTQNGVTLVGGARSNIQPWRFDDLGEKMLFQDRDFRIKFPSRNRLCVEYASADGAKERYCFWWGMSDPEMWVVERYEREYADGSGMIVANDYVDGGFRIAALDAGMGEGTVYPVNWVGWTVWMDSIADYPTTGQQALEMAEASWQHLDGRNIVMLYGNVNLRQKPTAASRSLGRYRDCALAYVIGQEPGKDAAWYHVRVGGVEGWVSGIYTRKPRTSAYTTNLYHGPLHLALLPAETALRASPSAGGEELARLPSDSMAYVIGEAAGGWLHISMADESLHWEMNPDALSGYVRASEVMEGSAVWHGLK